MSVFIIMEDKDVKSIVHRYDCRVNNVMYVELITIMQRDYAVLLSERKIEDLKNPSPAACLNKTNNL